MIPQVSPPCCYLNVHHSDELSWTVQTVETSLLHQLTHNLIGYLRETGGGDKYNNLIGAYSKVWGNSGAQ